MEQLLHEMRSDDEENADKCFNILNFLLNANQIKQLPLF